VRSLKTQNLVSYCPSGREISILITVPAMLSFFTFFSSFFRSTEQLTGVELITVINYVYGYIVYCCSNFRSYLLQSSTHCELGFPVVAPTTLFVLYLMHRHPERIKIQSTEHRSIVLWGSWFQILVRRQTVWFENFRAFLQSHQAYYWPVPWNMPRQLSYPSSFVMYHRIISHLIMQCGKVIIRNL
jgi:hypothetical protein